MARIIQHDTAVCFSQQDAIDQSITLFVYM